MSSLDAIIKAKALEIEILETRNEAFRCLIDDIWSHIKDWEPAVERFYHQDRLSTLDLQTVHITALRRQCKGLEREIANLRHTIEEESGECGKDQHRSTTGSLNSPTPAETREVESSEVTIAPAKENPKPKTAKSRLPIPSSSSWKPKLSPNDVDLRPESVSTDKTLSSRRSSSSA